MSNSLYVTIGKYGTGWIENLAFYNLGTTSQDRYAYPSSIQLAEVDSCCVGVRCKFLPQVVPNAYPLVPLSENGVNFDYWNEVRFIWDSPGIQ